MKKKTTLLFLLLPLCLALAAPAQELTLRQEARLKGFAWRTYQGEPPTVAGLDDLIGRSDLIIRGRVVDEKTRLSRYDELVLTDYTVEVLEVFQDGKQLTYEGDRIPLTRVGGNVVVEGKPIRLDNPHFAPIPWVDPYVFFVSRSEQTGEYSFVGGELGAIRISKLVGFQREKGKVACETRLRRNHPQIGQFCGREAKEFVESVRARIAALAQEKSQP